MHARKTVALLLCLFVAGKTCCQEIISSNEFDSIFNHAIAHIMTDSSAADADLRGLASFEGCSALQKAKIRFLQFSIIRSDKNKSVAIEKGMFYPADSVKPIDSLLYSSERYLERSMPDKAIPLLLKAIQMTSQDPVNTGFCKISLCEAYRQKREYAKGVSMLNGLFADNTSLSDDTRAYACNRLAALYNEWGHPAISYHDSVFKYSDLCIALSVKSGNKPNLAASQNELSLQYIMKKDYKKALELSLESIKNYSAAGMPFNAMNALINLSNLYIAEKKYGAALRAIEDAFDMSEMEQNRNLYMRLYGQLARIYHCMGEYKEAYDLLKISYQLQFDFFRDRIDMQINEQSAKYDLLIKDQKIKDEKQKIEFQRRQFAFLVVIMVSLFLAFMVSLFYFKLKRKEVNRQKLMEAVAETETLERKRIARDLHDGLGPVLSAINHYFQAFLDAKPGDKKAIQTRLQQVISESIDEVSRISHNISPQVLEDHGLITALDNFIVPLSRNNRIKVNFTSDLPERFDLKKELMVYRCITELLNNTMKHAGATQISIDICARDNRLFASYTDNGKGFDPEKKNSGGMGLSNINYRIKSFGGSLLIESAHGKGIKAAIEIPI